MPLTKKKGKFIKKMQKAREEDLSGKVRDWGVPQKGIICRSKIWVLKDESVSTPEERPSFGRSYPYQARRTPWAKIKTFYRRNIVRKSISLFTLVFISLKMVLPLKRLLFAKRGTTTPHRRKSNSAVVQIGKKKPISSYRDLRERMRQMGNNLKSKKTPFSWRPAKHSLFDFFFQFR